MPSTFVYILLTRTRHADDVCACARVVSVVRRRRTCIGRRRIAPGRRRRTGRARVCIDDDVSRLTKMEWARLVWMENWRAEKYFRLDSVFMSCPFAYFDGVTKSRSHRVHVSVGSEEMKCQSGSNSNLKRRKSFRSSTRFHLHASSCAFHDGLERVCTPGFGPLHKSPPCFATLQTLLNRFDSLPFEANRSPKSCISCFGDRIKEYKDILFISPTTRECQFCRS
jgi:hypothetical protein